MRLVIVDYHILAIKGHFAAVNYIRHLWSLLRAAARPLSISGETEAYA